MTLKGKLQTSKGVFRVDSFWHKWKQHFLALCLMTYKFIRKDFAALKT